MTPKQKQRIDAARQETAAAGGTLTHQKLGGGRLLVTETHGKKKTFTVLNADGDWVDTTETRILVAYHELSVKSQDWVRLAKLRPRVKRSRAAVDATILRMVRTGSVHLAPDSNTKVLTEVDHTAAMRVAGEDNHLLAIETDYDPVG